MPKYAGIIVDISHESVDRVFSYRIKESMRNDITIGACVTVPFGKGNKIVKGYVVSFQDTVDINDDKIKEIEEIIVKQDDTDGRMIALASWIREHYGSTMIQALKVVLPIKKTIKPVEKKTILLTATQDEAKNALDFFKKKNQKARVRILEELLQEEVLEYQLVRTKLNISLQTLHKLQEMGILTIESQDYFRNPIVIRKSKETDKKLLSDQQNIVDDFCKKYRQGIRGTYLIHGVTGSGKTEVYIRMIKDVVSQGKQVIFLIPEIALTYQTVMRFYHHFGDRVSVVNSALSYGEKFDQFMRAKQGELDVIIGPRSALFTPFQNLGLIVIDEEHENSYKSEGMPKYHARETAIELAKMTGSSVVLGSATPSIDSYYKAKNGEYTLYSMPDRVSGSVLPIVHTVDLRQELKEGNRSVFSRKLQELIAERLKKKEQIMLFLNRRGYAGFVSCRGCGHVMKCPHCDISLSEHRNGKLVCHYCGYEVSKPTSCPECGSKYLLGFRAGTEQIEEQIHQMFPQAGVLRMDADTTRQKDSYEKLLSVFSEGKADILVGTQMIVKGHDFPNVTLMGILAADLSLAANDYRAGERTFALLTQAAGRAGRGREPGEVVIQTYQPDHYSVVHAADQDYEGFYEEEILYRTFSSYPPVCHMAVVMLTGKEEKPVIRMADVLAEAITSEESDCIVIGPAPAGVRKINDIYRQIFMLKSKKEEKLIEAKNRIEECFDKQSAKEVSIQFDFNPINPY